MAIASYEVVRSGVSGASNTMKSLWAATLTNTPLGMKSVALLSTHSPKCRQPIPSIAQYFDRCLPRPVGRSVSNSIATNFQRPLTTNHVIDYNSRPMPDQTSCSAILLPMIKLLFRLCHAGHRTGIRCKYPVEIHRTNRALQPRTVPVVIISFQG